MNDKMTWQAAIVLMREALDEAKPIVEAVALRDKNAPAKAHARLCLKKIEVGIRAGDEVLP